MGAYSLGICEIKITHKIASVLNAKKWEGYRWNSFETTGVSERRQESNSGCLRTGWNLGMHLAIYSLLKALGSGSVKTKRRRLSEGGGSS